jgi:anti-anti-sigma factor
MALTGTALTGTGSNTGGSFRYGNPTFDCGNAQLRAQCRHLATVVTVTGSIDESGIDRISQYARHLVMTDKPLVLDLSAVDYFAPEAISVLDTVDEACQRADVEWYLVVNPNTMRTLRTAGDADTFPLAASVSDAVHDIADAIGARRQLLPLLTKSA